MQYLILLVVSGLLFTGCGVHTDSSQSGSAGTLPSEGNTTQPSEGNTTQPSEGNTTQPSEGNTTQPSDSDFDKEGAIEDSQACLSSNGYRAIVDNSLDPEGYTDVENSIKITSYYPFNTEPAKSEVKLFHTGLENRTQNLFTKVTHLSLYQFSFDNAWIDNSSRIIYIKTPLDDNGKYGCYRYDLNSTNSAEINDTKVYRLNQ